jgi:hypothetical protein
MINANIVLLVITKTHVYSGSIIYSTNNLRWKDEAESLHISAAENTSKQTKVRFIVS